MVDADSMPLQTPSTMFKHPQYIATGNMFWPSMWQGGSGCESVWQKLKNFATLRSGWRFRLFILRARCSRDKGKYANENWDDLDECAGF